MAIRGSPGVPPSETIHNGESFRKTYNSFSGVDMVVTFGGRVIGELQGISYTIQREKAPIYTMGSADPRAFSRGKRGIAGSLVFHVFDRSALLETFKDKPYVANGYDVEQGFQIADITPKTLEKATGLLGSAQGVQNITFTKIVITKVLASPQYADQVLPFDVVITASNEYGAFARMAIHNVEILNTGSGMSIDDISTDEACTFVATRITPWNSQGYIRSTGGGKSSEITS